MTTTITDTLTIETLLKKNENSHNVKIINDNDLNRDIITIKSLLFDVGINGNEETYLILLDIKRTVNITKLSQYFNNESRIQLTPKEKAEIISGCRMGTVHPLSSSFSLPVPIIIDEDLFQYDNF
jgi:prolyl-tRNA editing enzyme YbaK/EbsC (Cys-tRNA(Pro) deacylase)